MISLLKKEQSEELIEFLTIIFGDEHNITAKKHVAAIVFPINNYTSLYRLSRRFTTLLRSCLV